jgi:hypothetical protein
MAYYMSRVATHNGKRGYIACNDGACADDSATSDPAALKHEGSLAHPCPIFHNGEFDWRRRVIAHRLIEIVGPAVLLKEHAVRTNDDAIPEPGSVDSTSWTDTRSIGHV